VCENIQTIARSYTTVKFDAFDGLELVEEINVGGRSRLLFELYRAFLTPPVPPLSPLSKLLRELGLSFPLRPLYASKPNSLEMNFLKEAEYQRFLI
jgi:hypothetical protein